MWIFVFQLFRLYFVKPILVLRDISGSYGTMGVKYKNVVENMLNERYHRTRGTIEFNYAYIL